MTQKGKEGESENVIGRITALRWKPTHVTKHTFGVSPYNTLLDQETRRSGHLDNLLRSSRLEKFG